MSNQKSIKVNFIMNIILTGSSYIFPLITFPYISRILQATGNGKLNFALSVINYFVMFASLGIPMYGIKACAIVRDNKHELSKTVKELFILNFITSTVSFVVLLAMIAVVSKLQDYAELLLIDSVAIWLNLIGMEWLFKGLEEYAYITNRSIAFKIIGIVLMFIFVHKPSDYVVYAIITLIGSSGSLVLNVLRCRKLINFKIQGRIDLKKHIKPMVSFFLLSASWTVYTNLDSVMLGFLTNDAEVGYYAAAVKLKSILVSTISALGTVLLPRLTNYYSENRKSEFYSLLKIDGQFITISALYFTSFCVINAREIIIFLSGNTYLPAVPAMQIISISILFIGFSTMLGTNVLVPVGRENITMIATLIGLVIDALLNAIWIPTYGAAGAAAATVIGEISIFAFEAFYLRKSIRQMFDMISLLKEFIAIIVATAVLLFSKKIFIQMISNELLIIIFTGVIFSIIYLIVLLFFRDALTNKVFNNAIKN